METDGALGGVGTDGAGLLAGDFFSALEVAARLDEEDPVGTRVTTTFPTLPFFKGDDDDDFAGDGFFEEDAREGDDFATMAAAVMAGVGGGAGLSGIDDGSDDDGGDDGDEDEVGEREGDDVEEVEGGDVRGDAGGGGEGGSAERIGSPSNTD